MPPVGFEPTISASERPQIYAFDRAASRERGILQIVVFWCCFWRWLLSGLQVWNSCTMSAAPYPPLTGLLALLTLTLLSLVGVTDTDTTVTCWRYWHWHYCHLLALWHWHYCHLALWHWHYCHLLALLTLTLMSLVGVMTLTIMSLVGVLTLTLLPLGVTDTDPAVTCSILHCSSSVYVYLLHVRKLF